MAHPNHPCPTRQCLPSAAPAPGVHLMFAAPPAAWSPGRPAPPATTRHMHVGPLHSSCALMEAHKGEQALMEAHKGEQALMKAHEGDLGLYGMALSCEGQ